MSLTAYLADAGQTPPSLQALGRALHGVVSWNLNDACNYRCSYCTQRFQKDRSRQLGDPARALHQLGTLPGAWEIKLSGGEPFVQPGLVELVASLVAQGHLISVQTNFSAPDALLERFFAATRGALHLFSASLHLEHTTPEAFAERYQRLIQPWEAAGVRFHVTSVAVPARLPELHDRIAPYFRERGIVFKVQPEKVHGVVRKYTAAEERLLLDLGGHNLTRQIAPNYQGRLCWAGSRYLVIKSSGTAWRCYAASRVGGRHAHLGDLHAGLVLLTGPRLCPYVHCCCTVPIQRGMIDGVPPGRDGGGD
ncbi:MAG: radical SAM protein [Myxococcota bacterium]|jgi:hypothetical protein|nr:radical SAM protein [Myxococcota bacterium]